MKKVKDCTYDELLKFKKRMNLTSKTWNELLKNPNAVIDLHQAPEGVEKRIIELIEDMKAKGFELKESRHNYGNFKCLEFRSSKYKTMYVDMVYHFSEDEKDEDHCIFIYLKDNILKTEDDFYRNTTTDEEMFNSYIDLCVENLLTIKSDRKNIIEDMKDIVEKYHFNKVI